MASGARKACFVGYELVQQSGRDVRQRFGDEPLESHAAIEDVAQGSFACLAELAEKRNAIEEAFLLQQSFAPSIDRCDQFAQVSLRAFGIH